MSSDVRIIGLRIVRILLLLIMFYISAISWIITEAETTLPCSKLAIIDTGLSQLINVSNKADFAVGLYFGLVQLLKNDYQEAFNQQVSFKILLVFVILSFHFFRYLNGLAYQFRHNILFIIHLAFHLPPQLVQKLCI